MSNLIRIILGVGVIMAAVLAKKNVSPAQSEDMDSVPTVTLWGIETSPTGLNLIVGAIALIGLVMIVLGAIGALKKGA